MRLEDPSEEEDLDRVLPVIIASPSKFCAAVLELKPYPYQAKFLEDRSKRIVVCAGRQVGKSLITSARALWFAMTHPATITLIVSATQRQSVLMFDKILDYVESSDVVMESVVRKTRTMVSFSNGSRIHALPCGRQGKSLRAHRAPDRCR